VLAAEAVGARVRWAEFDPATAELPAEAVAEVLSPRTRLVAVTAASNLLGTCPPVRAITDLAHDAGALAYVDGVHAAAHLPVHLDALGADFFTCSPYKFLGPHCGVLAAAPAVLDGLRPQKLLPSPDVVPERFELGTLPYELLAGTTAAIDFLAGFGTGVSRRDRLVTALGAIGAHEDRLRERIEDGLARLPGVTVLSRAAHRTPTLLVTFAEREPAAAYAFLAERGVHAPAGAFYALEPSRRLGLGDTGALRIGLAPYVDDSDVERLLAGLAEFLGA
jgi:cysteine desulfurase family protein (TIGR01976 family)